MFGRSVGSVLKFVLMVITYSSRRQPSPRTPYTIRDARCGPRNRLLEDRPVHLIPTMGMVVLGEETNPYYVGASINAFL